jgi:hypothetical protein
MQLTTKKKTEGEGWDGVKRHLKRGFPLGWLGFHWPGKRTIQGLQRHLVSLKIPTEKKGPKNQKHTTAGIRWWSPTQLLICRSEACVWQSGRDAQFSSVCDARASDPASRGWFLGSRNRYSHCRFLEHVRQSRTYTWAQKLLPRIQRLIVGSTFFVRCRLQSGKASVPRKQVSH